MSQETYNEFYFRGIFSSICIDTEYILDQSITLLLSENPITPKTFPTFKQYVLSEITLHNKIKMCQELLKYMFPKLYKKYNPSLTKFRKLKNLRNKFSHLRFEVDIKNKNLIFEGYSKGKMIKNTGSFDFYRKEFKNFKSTINKVKSLVDEIPHSL